MFNPNNPLYQEDIRKVLSRQGPQRGVLRSRIGDVASAHAGYQEGRKQQWSRLGLAKKDSDEKARQFNKKYRLAKNQLRDDKKTGMYGLIGGLTTSALAGYEGYRRRKELEAFNARQNVMMNEIEQAIEAKRIGIPYKYLYGPGGR